MSSPVSEEVTPELLREWGLPDPGDSKKSRGRVMVVGGSAARPARCCSPARPRCASVPAGSAWSCPRRSRASSAS